MNRKHTRLLVESIIKGDKNKADRLLAKIITEAEEDRQDEAKDEANAQLGIQDQKEGTAPAEGDEFDTDADDLEADNEDSDDEFEELDDSPIDDADEFDAPEDTMESDTELNELVDKQVNFEVQINNLVLNDLINQVADLKTALENNTSLDKHSREFYEIKVPLQYYAETLTKIQKNITPLVNQDEIKKQLDEIKSSLQQLSDKIGADDEMSISTPGQVVDQELGAQFE